MAMNFEELDETTRQFMLAEFEAEESGGNPYRSADLSAAGQAVFPDLMRQAIHAGDDQSLIQSLLNLSFWKPTQTYVRAGVPRQRRINPQNAAERLGLTEFNTWYARGLARRLLEEHVETCQVYRADMAWEPRAECQQHEGLRYPVQLVYEGHRARYWPPPGNPGALSIPVGPNCHHSIRRAT